MTDPLPPLPESDIEFPTQGIVLKWTDAHMQDYALAAIEPWRANLAEQCGKTLAARAQRDELRGLAQGVLEDLCNIAHDGSNHESCGLCRTAERIRAALSRCATKEPE